MLVIAVQIVPRGTTLPPLQVVFHVEQCLPVGFPSWRKLRNRSTRRPHLWAKQTFWLQK